MADENTKKPDDDITSILAGPPISIGPMPASSVLAPPKATAPATAPAGASLAAAPPPATAAPQMTAEQLYAEAQARKQAREDEALKTQQKYEATELKIAEEEAQDAKKRLEKATEIQGKRGEVAYPKFNQVPYKPEKPTPLVEQWGSMAMLFAMLGSAFTRNRAVTALNAAASAMKGYQEGDKARAEQAYKEWKTANENLQKAADFEADHYKQIMKGLDSEEKLIEMQGTAKEKEFIAKRKANDAMFNNTQRIAIAKEHGEEAANLDVLRSMKNAEEFNRLTNYTNLVASEDYQNKTLAEKKAAIEKTGYIKGIENFQKHMDSPAGQREKIAEYKKTDPEYRKAVEEKNTLKQLELLEEQGDQESVKVIAKLRAEEAKQSRLEGKGGEAQRAVEQGIANYAIPLGIRPRTENAGKLWDDRYLRVKQLNPTFVEGDYGNRNLAYRHWVDPNGVGNKQVLSYTTLAQHLGELDMLVGELEKSRATGNSQLTNELKARISAGVGKPITAITDIQAARGLVADEIIKSATGSAGALLDREQQAAVLDGKLPISVLRSNINIMKDLVGGRINSAMSDFVAGTGRTKEDFYPLLTPEARVMFARPLEIGEEQYKKDLATLVKKKGTAAPGTTTPAATTPAATTPAATAPTAPAAKTYFKGDREIIVSDGKWVYKDTGEEAK